MVASGLTTSAVMQIGYILQGTPLQQAVIGSPYLEIKLAHSLFNISWKY